MHSTMQRTILAPVLWRCGLLSNLEQAAFLEPEQLELMEWISALTYSR